jgi:hypothetical protein
MIDLKNDINNIYLISSIVWQNYIFDRFSILYVFYIEFVIIDQRIFKYISPK